MTDTTRLNEARTALSVVSARTEWLVKSLPDTTAAIPGSTWTVRDAAVHLALVASRYAGMALGEPNPYPSLDPETCARLHDQLNADIPETHPAKLAGFIHEATARLLAASITGHDTQDVRFHGGTVITVPYLVGALLAEHEVHGSDIALAVGRRWPIDPRHALLALFASGPSYGLGCPSASQTRERNLR